MNIYKWNLIIKLLILKICKNENEYIDFWLHDYSILFNSKYIYDLWPKENMSRTQNLMLFLD